MRAGVGKWGWDDEKEKELARDSLLIRIVRNRIDLFIDDAVDVAIADGVLSLGFGC